MKANPIFEKHRRQITIAALFEHECLLIREACADAVARCGDEPISALQARFEEEEGRAIAWCEWLLNQCEREFSGGLGYRHIDKPSGECAPRSRRRWMSSLGGDIRLMKDDFLWQMIVAFVVGYMIAQLTGHGDDDCERDELERALRQRLRIADEEAAKGETDGEQRRNALKAGRKK